MTIAPLLPVAPVGAALSGSNTAVVTGEVQRLVVDLAGGVALELTAIVPDDGRAVRVDDLALDGIPTGAVARVSTEAPTEENQSIVASSEGAEVLAVTLVEPAAATDQASASASQPELAEASTLGARTVAVTTATLPGQAPDGMMPTTIAAEIDSSVRSYWSDSTGGAVTFSAGAQVAAGTYSGWGNTGTCTTAQILAFLDWNATQAGVAPTAGTRRHSVTYTPRVPACGFSGVAHVADGGSAWINGTGAATRPNVIAHELGHTLTLGHSQSRWGCSTGADGPVEMCSIGEYGDAYDVMGLQLSGAGPLSGAQLAVLGLSSGSSLVPVDEASEVTLQPVGGLTGTRFARFSTGGATYVVEYRGAVGRDVDLASSRQGCPTGVSTCTYQRYLPGVVVHRLDDTGPGASTYLLDVGAGDVGHVSTRPRFALGVDESFTTVDGAVTLTVEGLSGSGMRVSLTPAASPGAYTPVGPFRLHDRRTGVDPGVVTCVPVVGSVPGVRSGASGVVLNVTTVIPTGVGHVVVYPDTAGDGTTLPPDTSTVNFIPGRDVANAAFIELPPNGQICYFIRGSRAGVVIDVTGFTADAGMTLQRPVRLEDRHGVSSGTPVTVQVTGRGGVPAGATAVILNVAAAGSSAAGNLRMWATDTPRPGTSMLNFASSGDRASAAVVQLSPEGRVTYESETFATNDVRVVLDVVGYVLEGSAFMPLTPTRLVDTRAAVPLDAGHALSLVVGSAQGVPDGATAVVLNVVGVSPTTVGNLRVYPFRSGDTTVAAASTLNYIPGADVANLVVVGIGDDRRVQLFTDQLSGGRTHVVADLVGYLDDGDAPTT